MNATEIYDWLLAMGVKDPVALVLGTRHVVGQWANVSNFLDGYICRQGNVAIVVLGEADNWPDAHAQAKARLSQ